MEIPLSLNMDSLEFHKDTKTDFWTFLYSIIRDWKMGINPIILIVGRSQMGKSTTASLITKQLKEKFKYDTESLKTQCLDDIKKVCSEYQEKIDKLQTNYDKFIVENQKNIDETIRKALEPVNLAIKGIEKKENANQERVKKVAGIFGKASELLGGE